MEVYSVGLLRCVSIAADRRKLGVDKVSEPVLSCVSFEGTSYVRVQGQERVI